MPVYSATNQLRWLVKDGKIVLQQAYAIQGRFIKQEIQWRDVPIVEENDEEVCDENGK